MTDARSSIPMDALRALVGAAREAVTRAVSWSLATVEDDTRRNVIPMPGPAYGPVPAIRLRVEEQQRRRKAS